MPKILALTENLNPAEDSQVVVVDPLGGPGATKRAALSSISKLRTFGELYVAGGIVAQTAIDGTFAKVTGFAAEGESQNVTLDLAGDQITILRAGTYLVMASLSFSGSGNTVFTFRGAIDGAAQPQMSAIRKVGSGGDIGSCALSGLLVLAAAEELSIMVKSDGTGDELTLSEGSLTALKIS